MNLNVYILIKRINLFLKNFGIYDKISFFYYDLKLAKKYKNELDDHKNINLIFYIFFIFYKNSKFLNNRFYNYNL